MNALQRAIPSALAVVAIAGSTVGIATPASALSYHCKTSTASIDDPTAHPQNDNWDFKVKNCAARSGSYVYSYATITWDGGWYPDLDDKGLFNGAYYKLQAKKSKKGPDPVISSHKRDIQNRLENSNSSGDYDGSYRTPTYKTKISKYGLTDGSLHLEWQGDGRGYVRTLFSASPRV